jgi:hypothetical protein
MSLELDLAEIVRTVVRDEIRAALAERTAATAVLDRAGLAMTLGCSLASVDRLLREGVPCVRLGSDPRFVATDVVGWLRERGRA